MQNFISRKKKLLLLDSHTLLWMLVQRYVYLSARMNALPLCNSFMKGFCLTTCLWRPTLRTVIKPALPLREAHCSSWNSGFDSVRVWYIFLWSLHLHLFWQGTMWEEEGVIFKWCCFAVRVKVNLQAQDLKLTSPQVVWDSGENEPVIFVGNLQRHI